MPPEDDSPEAEKPKNAAAASADVADEPAAGAAEGPAADAAKKPDTRPGSERTRSIVLMVLATLGLTVVFTLISESIWHKPKPPPSLSANAFGDDDASARASAPRVVDTSASPIIVTIKFDTIQVDGIDVARTPEVVDAKKPVRIVALQTAMEQKRGGNRIGGKVGLAVEKGTPKDVIRSVFLTLAVAGYRDVHLVGALADAEAPLGDD